MAATLDADSSMNVSVDKVPTTLAIAGGKGKLLAKRVSNNLIIVFIDAMQIKSMYLDV